MLSMKLAMIITEDKYTLKSKVIDDRSIGLLLITTISLKKQFNIPQTLPIKELKLCFQDASI